MNGTLTDTKQLPKEEITAFVTEDLLDRDPVTFVKIRKTDRLGWESSLPEGGAYSSFIMNPKSKTDLIRNAYALASNMITAMNTPHKVKIRLSPDQSRTNSKDLFVATNMFDDEDVPLGIRMDAFLGDVIHEGCHLLYTAFGTRNGIPTARFVKMLANVIEDERIERKLGHDKPGLANFLISMKYWSFDKYEQNFAQKKIDDAIIRLFNAILHLVRYPKSLTKDETEEFGGVLYNVKEVLTPFPSSTQEAYETAERIYELMKDYLQDSGEEEEGSDQSENNSDNQQSDSGEPQGNQPQGNGMSSDSKPESSEGQNGKSKESQEDGAEDPDGKETPGGGDGSRQNSCRMSDDEAERAIDDAMKEIEDMVNGLTGNEDKEDQTSEVLQKDNLLAKECEGELERGMASNLIVRQAGENRFEYELSLRRVNKYIGAISKSLRYNDTEYRYSLLGMRSGKLDTNKLAEAIQGVQTVYCRQGSVKAEKASVVLLIDESGSMWGEGERAARDTAVLINEAVHKIKNIELFVYGYTSERLMIYKEGATKSKYTLGTTESRGGTPTAEAIMEVTARVRKQTATPCLFFVISDGDPNGTFRQVRDAVDAAEKANFSVIGVNIGDISEKALETMYPQWVNFRTLAELAPKLSNIIRKSIIKMTSYKKIA